MKRATRQRAWLVWMAAGLTAALSGCRQPGSSVLGVVSSGTPVNVAAAVASTNVTSLAVQGIMTEKCPVAGCWFVLRDATGTLKVDTKSAGFVVVDVPLNSPVTVSGRMLHDGTGATLAATGVRY